MTIRGTSQKQSKTGPQRQKQQAPTLQPPNVVVFVIVVVVVVVAVVVVRDHRASPSEVLTVLDT